MKKWIVTLLLTAAVISLTGCSNRTVSVKNKDSIITKEVGIDRMENIGGNLAYDSSTGIVYWYSSVMNCHPTPYFSENGKLYRYDPVKNMFTEVDGE